MEHKKIFLSKELSLQQLKINNHRVRDFSYFVKCFKKTFFLFSYACNYVNVNFLYLFYISKLNEDMKLN